MHEELKQRLESLKAEFGAGQRRQQDLHGEQTALYESLLRISGAIQVLEELLTEPDAKPKANMRSVESM